MLKKIVPTSWIRVAHQSIRPGSNVISRIRLVRRPAGSRSALAASRYCNRAAEVKKTEPAKNTVPSAAEPTRPAKPGNGPRRKQTDPIANRTPIHHEAWPGAHQRRRGRVARERREACLRANRDDHWAISPSGRR